MFVRILFMGMFIWNLFAAPDSIFAQNITSWASGLGKPVSIVSAGDRLCSPIYCRICRLEFI